MRLRAKTVLTSVFGVSLAIWAAPIVSTAEPPPIPTATVTSDGRILEIVATGAAGTDGALGDGAVVEAPANHDQIGPLALVTNHTIIGKDNRTKVTNTTNSPARMVALMTYAGNQWCTGFLIGPETLVTSGHCVFNIGTGTWYDPAQMTVYLGYDSSVPNPAPYGSCGVRLLLSTTGWTTYHSDEYDYGAVKLTCYVGYQTGWFGWWHQSASLNGTQSRNHGYAADKALSQWRTTDRIRVSEARRLYYANDTYGGNSGSPVFAKRAAGASQCAGWCVMSVHGYGLYGSYPNSSFNHGVRVNQEVSDAFFSWRAV